MYKLIVQVIHLDTNATTTSKITQLISLYKYIGKVVYDITKCKSQLQVLLDGLTTITETTKNIFTKLLK